MVTQGHTPQPVNRSLEWELLGWRGRRGRFVAASHTARERVRNAAATRGRAVLAALRDLSPRGPDRAPHPKSRRRPEPRVRFAESWRGTLTETPDGAVWSAANVAPHAPFVLLDTRPHVITPRDAKRLVFRAGGAGGPWVFARSVRHPGTTASDVLDRVLDTTAPGTEREMQAVVRDVIQTVRDIFED